MKFRNKILELVSPFHTKERSPLYHRKQTQVNLFDTKFNENCQIYHSNPHQNEHNQKNSLQILRSKLSGHQGSC